MPLFPRSRRQPPGAGRLSIARRCRPPRRVGPGFARMRVYNDPDMAILKVARLGHPVLREVAKPVPESEIRSSGTQRLIDDMIETMREYNGAGLAAPQVHTLVQIAVIEVQRNPRYPDAPEIPLTVLVNPVVTPLTEEMEDGWEGCLSVPDMRGVVPRSRRSPDRAHRQGVLRPCGAARDRSSPRHRLRRSHAGPEHAHAPCGVEEVLARCFRAG